MKLELDTKTYNGAGRYDLRSEYAASLAIQERTSIPTAEQAAAWSKWQKAQKAAGFSIFGIGKWGRK